MKGNPEGLRRHIFGNVFWSQRKATTLAGIAKRSSPRAAVFLSLKACITLPLWLAPRGRLCGSADRPICFNQSRALRARRARNVRSVSTKHLVRRTPDRYILQHSDRPFEFESCAFICICFWFKNIFHARSAWHPRSFTKACRAAPKLAKIYEILS